MDKELFDQLQDFLRYRLNPEMLPPAGNAERWLRFTGGVEVVPAAVHLAQRRVLSRPGIDAMMTEYRALRAGLAGSPELAAIDHRLSRELFELVRMTNRYAAT